MTPALHLTVLQRPPISAMAGQPYCIQISVGNSVMYHGDFATTQDAEDFVKTLLANIKFTLSTGNKQ